MAGFKMQWNSLAVRLMLSFPLFVLPVTAVLPNLPPTLARDTLTEGLARRGEARLKRVQDSISGYLLLGMGNSVQSSLAEFPKGLTEVSYLAVANPDGTFLAHSDPAQVEKPWSGKG